MIYQSIQTFLKTKGTAKLYDLIIMDLQMPILDGYEACKKITRLYENNGLCSQNSEVKNSHDGLNSDYSMEAEMKWLKPVIIACTSHIT